MRERGSARHHIGGRAGAAINSKKGAGRQLKGSRQEASEAAAACTPVAEPIESFF